jgi:hypothetical protein
MVPGGTLPNWCDPAQPIWTPSPYSRLFRELHEKALKQPPSPDRGVHPGELLVSGLAADDLALLLPEDPALVETLGTRAAADGTAWIDAPQPGAYQLVFEGGSQPVRVGAGPLPQRPGYDDVQRIEVSRK